MKILTIHSYYQQGGGEDVVFHAERDALRQAGHAVETYVLYNTEYVKKPKWQQLLSLFWNGDAYGEVRKNIQYFQPDILHVHNLFPFLSPSILWAAKKEKTPIVVTLHNYRLMCANGLFYRVDKACEKCVGKLFPWPSVKYECYRIDRVKTLLVSASMFFHRLIGSWDIPSNFIVPTEFAAKKFFSLISENRIQVKPHFATAYPSGSIEKNNHIIFVGRLSVEKGFNWLLEVWQTLGANIILEIVGDGEMPINLDPRIIFHGRLEPEKLRAMLAQSAAVVIPSRCYETFSNIVVEAFAAGTAVIAPLNTAPGSLIIQGKTGSLFPRDDVLAFQKLVTEYSKDSERSVREGKNAFKVYQQQYQAKENVAMLLEIYQRSSSSI